MTTVSKRTSRSGPNLDGSPSEDRLRRAARLRAPASGVRSVPRFASSTHQQLLIHFVGRSPRYDPTELQGPAEIPLEIRRAILDAYYAMGDMSFYELLNVDARADKRTIRSAYFELSKFFHPDSLFGRDLGAFRKKMEAVFIRLTQAYEVLGNKHKRRAYDEFASYMRDLG